MRTTFLLLCGLIPLVFASFKSSKACLYAGSNIEFIQTQTKKAITTEDLNLAKYFAYKAINAIEKSRSQLADCGCEQATGLIDEGADNLKLATKATTITSSRILLKKALDYTIGGSEALEQHDSHNSRYSNDLLALNTTESIAEKKAIKKINTKELEKTIDKSLKRFKESMDQVVISVDCKEAYNYAKKVFTLCEKQLLLPNLSEGKKYYNLKTKEIAAQALRDIGDCDE
ncbi:hypothetical protein DHD08_13635 [Arenibacter sp. H213]|uniref:DUF4142 domain-containing protein n=1 Tax=Arenibacter antarcticus TaxID=2040469 RepID=A0ABW5VII5_9FLAO|nr:hypothetical protein [Arenibacter sp. H213]MCM4168725.1 hypothetical protein [Arenibacter sp. H213]